MSKTFKMTESEYLSGASDYEGRCIECGDWADGVEPDARKYECEACGEHAVYGLEELMLMGLIKLTEGSFSAFEEEEIERAADIVEDVELERAWSKVNR